MGEIPAINEDENISEDDIGEEKSSKVYNYDSSYFSKKMTEVDKKGLQRFEMKSNVHGLHVSATPI